MNGKKVLILANYDVGLYKFRKELIERLLKEKCEVYISVPDGEYIPNLVEMGCVFVNTEVDRRGTNPIRDFKLLLRYRKIIKSIQPDIIFTYTIKPNIYGALAAKGQNIPCVANITGLGTAIENGGIVQKIILALYKLAFTKIKRVFFQNVENMEFFKKYNIAVDKAALLPGSGVNLTKFSVLDYPAQNTVEFAFISRIMKEKGVEQYLDMAENIKSKYSNTVFHVCGFCEQAYEERLKNLENRGIIKYHGMVRDIRQVLKSVHCTIHPTYYPEGLSNVLLESSACGRAIITTNRSGCKEVIDDSKNGYIVRQQDTQDLIEKVEKFIALPWEEKKNMGLYGRNKVEKEFDRQIVVEAYVREMLV